MNGALVIENCTFDGNEAVGGNGGQGNGGGGLSGNGGGENLLSGGGGVAVGRVAAHSAIKVTEGVL
jgi:hypothetical protein